MKQRSSMFMFGMRCVRCDNEIIAPHKTELLYNNPSVIYGTAVAARPTSSPFRASAQGPVSEGTDDERRCLSAVEWNLIKHCPFLGKLRWD
jgi:hypothetical protein